MSLSLWIIFDVIQIDPASIRFPPAIFYFKDGNMVAFLIGIDLLRGRIGFFANVQSNCDDGTSGGLHRVRQLHIHHADPALFGVTPTIDNRKDLNGIVLHIAA